MNCSSLKLVKRYVNRALLFATTFVALSFNTVANDQGENHWSIWKENSDISVAYSTNQNSAFSEIKASVKLSSNLSGFISFISDYEHLPNWLVNSESASLIEQISPQENIFITSFQGIWPVKPREMVITSRISQNKDYSLDIHVTDASDKHPVSPEFIRMQVIKAHWKIIPVNTNEIEVTYSFIVDAKGNIPKWLSKRMALSSIWATLNNIKQQVPDDKWQKLTLPYISEYPSN